MKKRPGIANHERVKRRVQAERPFRVRVWIVLVGVDILFFRHRFLERLVVNVGIVVVFAAFYLRFLKRP